MLSAITPRYRDPHLLSELRDRFERDRVLILDDLLSPATFDYVATEAESLRRRRRHRRFEMEEFASWRDMAVVGGDTVLEHSPGLALLYGHVDFAAFLEAVADGPVHVCEATYEWCVINFFDGQGATQGWHLDDTAFVLIIMLDEAVSTSRHGGALECRVDWPEYRAHQEERGLTASVPLMEAYDDPWRQIDVYLQRGQVCLMRGDRVMHRVSPIRDRGHRHTLLLSWQHQAHVPRDGTGLKLYT